MGPSSIYYIAPMKLSKILLYLGVDVRDPSFLHSSALLGSESLANTSVSCLPAIALSPASFMLSFPFLLGIRKLHWYLWDFCALQTFVACETKAPFACMSFCPALGLKQHGSSP